MEEDELMVRLRQRTNGKVDILRERHRVDFISSGIPPDDEESDWQRFIRDYDRWLDTSMSLLS